MTEEIKLLQASLKGDTRAFEAIVRKYQGLICAITFSGTGRVDISEELAHETFLRAWKNLGQLKDLGGFRAWLCTIARNLLHGHYRRKQPVVLDDSVMAGMTDPGDGPEERLAGREELVLLEEAILRLPESYREPLVLYYRQEKSIREVAAVLGINESAVQTRLYRARQVLREEVAARLERALERTAPGKGFTKAVMAAVGGAAAGLAGSAEAAVGGAASTGSATVLGTLTVKLAAAAAVIAVAAGAVFVFRPGEAGAPAMAQTEVSVVMDAAKPDLDLPVQEADAPAESPAVAVISDASETVAEPVRSYVDPARQSAFEPPVRPVPANVEASKPVFESQGVLSGLVTDAQTGAPVADAEVTISPGRLQRTTTDPNGFYSFESIEKDGDYSIGVFSNAYIGFTSFDTQPKMHLKKNGQAVKHFQLERACMIDLYVMDVEGNPVSNTRVWASSLETEQGREVGRSYVSLRTNEEGYIQLGGFAPSELPYVITALHTTEGGWVEKYGQKFREQVPDFAPGHLKVTLTDPNVVEYGEIVLQKGVEVKGIATYIDGAPARECRIAPYPDWWHSTTCPPDFAIEPNGLFTLSHLSPGTYRILASIPMSESSSRGVMLMSTQLPPAKDELLELIIPEKPEPADRVGTNSAANATLYGLVTDAATGKPIRDFRLRYKRVGISHYSTEGEWTQFSHEKGLFELDVTDGEKAVCRVQAVAEGYAARWSGEVDMQGRAAALIRLTRGGGLTGTVVDIEGEPIAKATVVPLSTAGGIQGTPEPHFTCEEGAVVTDAEGRFTLPHLAAGTETLKITHPDYTFAMVEGLTVAEGQVSDAGPITLGRGGAVEGVLCDDEGRPLTGLPVYVQNHFGFSSSDVRYATAVTDPNGRFRMDKLPEQLCYVVRPRSYQLTGVVSRGFVPVDGQVTRLNFGGGPKVRGRLVVGGMPLKHTQMTLVLGESSVGGLFRCQAETDEDGRFELTAGAPGTYTLFFEKRAKISTSVKVEEMRVGEEDLDLGTVPMAETTLRFRIEAAQTPTEIMRFFYLREQDPQTGTCVFWLDEPWETDQVYTVNITRPGIYYAVVQAAGGREYRFPVEVAEGMRELDVTLPIPSGGVTVTGALPDKISHVYFAGEDRSVSGILYTPTGEAGFRVEGLKPGTYRFNPKWPYYEDAVAVTIPEAAEHTLRLDAAALYGALRERIVVHVFDAQGLPVEEAAVWVEGGGRRVTPVEADGYSYVFCLPGGEHVIRAEKDGLSGARLYRFEIEIDNSDSGESFETFVRLDGEDKAD